MEWRWDPDKNNVNLQKHGIGFETAVLVFNDLLALTIKDPYTDEERWRTIGKIATIIIIVIHTYPESVPESGVEIGRIISARKATSHERKAYEEGEY